MMNWLFLLPLSDINDCWRNTTVERKLITAIIMAESAGNECATRYEEKWSYFLDVEKHANTLGISKQTEQIHQATSWGLMQVMGSVARELGFNEHLAKLCDRKTNIRYGCLKLESIRKRYSKIDDIIAAYNAGSVIMTTDGKYKNEDYVLKVKSYYNQL